MFIYLYIYIFIYIYIYKRFFFEFNRRHSLSAIKQLKKQTSKSIKPKVYSNNIYERMNTMRCKKQNKCSINEKNTTSTKIQKV